MNRKIWFALCCAVAIGFRFYYNAHGITDNTPVLLVPFLICWVAFILPAILPVVLIEDGAFHFAPWADGHNATTILCATLLACLIWFFPPRVARWFGTFDAVGDAGKGRLPSLSRGAASVLDALTRLRIGKGKQGGWA